MVETLTYIREKKIPCLGICLGMQLMSIEFARNILDIPHANSLEFDKDCAPHDIITLLDSQKGVVNLGGTMRLGEQGSLLKDGIIESLYETSGRATQSNVIYERFRHRYEVHPEFAKKLE